MVFNIEGLNPFNQVNWSNLRDDVKAAVSLSVLIPLIRSIGQIHLFAVLYNKTVF